MSAFAAGGMNTACASGDTQDGRCLCSDQRMCSGWRRVEMYCAIFGRELAAVPIAASPITAPSGSALPLSTARARLAEILTAAPAPVETMRATRCSALLSSG